MTETYSQFGCPGDQFIDVQDSNIKIIIDPPKSYFGQKLKEDRLNFDKLILIQGMEPKDLNYISKEIIDNSSNFDVILTSFDEVINTCGNAELFLYASCWILTDKDKNSVPLRKDYHNIFTTKKEFKVSHVMSQKNFLPGHNLRHKTKDLVNKKRKFELFFPPYIPMSEKYKLFENSMFHIAIENTKNHNYISEKIVDCFMSYTIPIYWGCPNVGDYFNTDGIIFFNDENELNNILDNLTINDYNKRLDAIKENYEIATKYAFYYDRVNEVIDKITKIN